MKFSYGIDVTKYSRFVELMGSYSRFFSMSDTPYYAPKFVELLYMHCTGAEPRYGENSSFDFVFPKVAAVGVKTFTLSASSQASREKVAEFGSKVLRSPNFSVLSTADKALLIANERNIRVERDLNALELGPSGHIYHCLVRKPSAWAIHEENYPFSIDVNSIRPTDSRGNDVKKFPESGHFYFRDNLNYYNFNVTKNVLYKRFDCSSLTARDWYPIKMLDNPFQDNEFNTPFQFEEQDLGAPAIDYVVLPLYGTKSSISKVVPARSGINQWNANGRQRRFGEAYIPVPAAIQRANFFPDKQTTFSLSLPSGKVVSAKMCQQGAEKHLGKAIMSDPNTDLMGWLYSILDGSIEKAEARLKRQHPYTYSDLSSKDFDCVVVKKSRGLQHEYSIELGEINQYEEFVRLTDEQP